MKNNVYINYSGATDKTGSLLAEALDIQGGVKSAGKTKAIVIGWGAKTKDNIDLGKAKVLNHPDKIKVNRNKLKAMELMLAAKVNIAPFAPAETVISALDNKKNTMVLPVIGRTNYHQGGANFFTCLTKTHVTDVIGVLNNKLGKRGYFQNYVDVKEEYRLHIVLDQLIYAVKKTRRSNLTEAYVEQQSDKIKRMAEKKGVDINDDTLKYALEYQGKKIAGSDNIVRSNTRGWRFSSIKIENVPHDLIVESIKALRALDLEFGAVDCVIDTDGKAWIIEVNTGPGLEGTSFKKYVETFAKVINDILNPPKKTSEKVISKLKGALSKKPHLGSKIPDFLPEKDGEIDSKKLRMLADMLDNCDDDTEKDAVNRVAQRMFG
jgi:glutathione synthase/RimK-type ligase-like ATP-grasp enzyme